MIEGGHIDLDALFDSDMLGDDLDAWLAESSLMKRTFRLAAVIAGLIEKRSPGRRRAAGKSPSPPISSTTCCAAMIPAIFCWKQRGTMQRLGCSTSRG